LTAVASDHYPWLPVGLLLQHRMDPAEELKAVQTPVALITGEHDTIIRSARADSLRRAVPNLVSFRTIGGAGHNDIYHMPAFREAMRQAMADILSLPDGSAALVPL
ncbi:MAG: alpha/beta hydrolase, partial [Hyphomicrobium sp.]